MVDSLVSTLRFESCNYCYNYKHLCVWPLILLLIFYGNVVDSFVSENNCGHSSVNVGCLCHIHVKCALLPTFFTWKI